MSKKQKSELIDLITKFTNSDDEEFAEIVREAIAYGIKKEDIAQECGVAISTVGRWSRGASIPSATVKSFVIDTIEYLLDKE